MAGDLPGLAQAALDEQAIVVGGAKDCAERRYDEQRVRLKELIRETVGIAPDDDSFKPDPSSPDRAVCTFGGFRFIVDWTAVFGSRLYAAWVCRRCDQARDFKLVTAMSDLGRVARVGMVQEKHCWGQS